MARGLEKKTGTILILLLAFIYAGYRFVLMPQIQAYQITKTDLNETRALISRLSAGAGTLEEEKKVLEKTQKRFLELNNRFNTDMQDGQFLVQFSRVTEKNRVLVLKFKPLAIVDRGYVLVLPVEIELKGLFPQVTVVIDYLENLPNFSELRNIQITRYEPENAGGQSPTLPDGTVTASTTLLLYSRPTPAGRLQLEEVRRWALGRPNPFVSGRPPISSALPEKASGTAGQGSVPASF
ncbi:type 4a pilus biogenesis protein PilO [Desulfofundulus thermobenzoicus]|nr:type 4a pilus biogenesis protein PilO [Desulfofundulus thermobenzoicus]